VEVLYSIKTYKSVGIMKSQDVKKEFIQLRAKGLSFDKISKEINTSKPTLLKLNPALALILQKNKGLENEKTGQTLFEESLSGELPMTGQLSNHFIEGMRKIYELEPFIKLETSLSAEQGKGQKIYKRAV
jgi:glutaredoxin-related protein